MNKEILELQQIIEECCILYDNDGNIVGNKCYDCEYYCYTNNLCCSYSMKKALAVFNAGYQQKVDKDSVVLTKEEYETLTDIKALQLQVQHALSNMDTKDIANIEQQARKQIVKEILQELKETILQESVNDYNFDEKVIESQILLNKLDKLAKQNGVDI